MTRMMVASRAGPSSIHIGRATAMRYGEWQWDGLGIYREDSHWRRFPDCLGCSPVRETGKGLSLEGVKEDTHFHDALLGLT